jgi:hypothetical protein
VYVFVIIIYYYWFNFNVWFCPGTPFSSTNKTDRHNITEILLKVALNTINQTILMDYFMFQIYQNIYTIHLNFLLERYKKGLLSPWKHVNVQNKFLTAFECGLAYNK